jgi:hypothetical protein
MYWLFSTLLFAILILPFPIALMTALSWGVEAAWKVVFRTQPPFGQYSIWALAASLVLAAFGVYVVPAYAAIYEGYIAYLPWYTNLLVNYGQLLPVLVILTVALFILLKDNPRRERYFALMVAGEVLFLVLAVIALNTPTLFFGEAVSG